MRMNFEFRSGLQKGLLNLNAKLYNKFFPQHTDGFETVAHFQIKQSKLDHSQ